jgi:hypothetical protein
LQAAFPHRQEFEGYSPINEINEQKNDTGAHEWLSTFPRPRVILYEMGQVGLLLMAAPANIITVNP